MKRNEFIEFAPVKYSFRLLYTPACVQSIDNAQCAHNLNGQQCHPRERIAHLNYQVKKKIVDQF